MAMHIGTQHHPRTIQSPVIAADRVRFRSRYLALILTSSILAMAVILSGWPSQPSRLSPAVQLAVSESLAQDKPDAPSRLERASMAAWGDLNIEFSVRDLGLADVDRAAALDDVLAMTRAVYSLPEPGPLNVTMIGVWRASSSAHAIPVLYASMPADRLVGVDWDSIRRDDLDALGVVRWLPTGVCQAWHDCV